MREETGQGGQAKNRRDREKKTNGSGRADDFANEWRQAFEDDIPYPLLPSLPPMVPYPVDHMGPLSKITKAIARATVVDPALAAGSVWAVASLAAMGHGDVLPPFEGKPEPLSLFMATAAKSGARKSAADARAKKGIVQREEELRNVEKAEGKHFRAHKAAYEAQVRKILAETVSKTVPAPQQVTSKTQRIEALQEPVPPLGSSLIVGDTSLEALLKQWQDDQPIQAFFSTEGGIFTKGVAMDDERKAVSGATLNLLWDGADFIRKRSVSNERSNIFGKRLAFHIMLQLRLASGFFGDMDLEDQGVLARMLLAMPPTFDTPYRDPDPADTTEIDKFAERILALLRHPMPVEDRNILRPQPLTIGPSAKVIVVDYYNEVVSQLGDRYATIYPTARKSVSQAMRLAGVMEVVGGLVIRGKGSHLAVSEVSARCMKDGVTVARWYLEERLRLQAPPATDGHLADAQKLRDWLVQNPGSCTMRDILRLGPTRSRNYAYAMRLLKTLEDHLWVIPSPGGYKKGFTMHKPHSS